MSTDRDVERIVRSWMDEGVTALPDRVLDLVLDQIPATPQRRASWLARRFPIMNNSFVRIGLAAATVVLVAIVGINLIAPNIGGPPEATPTASAEVTPIPTATATQMAQLNGQEPLPAGRYQVEPALPVLVTVEVPDGWSAGDSWLVRGPKGNDAPDGMAIRFYTVLSLHANPLSPGLLPPVGPTVEDLVNAMLDHPDWTTTGPTAITIDGYAGQVVHLTLPASVSEATPFYLFGDTRGGHVYAWSPDQIFDIYVIDVDGERLVIEVFSYPDTSEADLAAQQNVLDSIQLAP